MTEESSKGEYSLFNVPKEDIVKETLSIYHKFHPEIPIDYLEERITDIVGIMDEETKKYNGWTDEARKAMKERIDLCINSKSVD